MIAGLGVPVTIEKTEDHVPSFMEKWVWFQVTRQEGEVKEEVNGQKEAEAVNGSTEQKEDKTQGEKEEKDEEKMEEKKEEKKEDKKEDKKEEKKEEKKDEKGSKAVPKEDTKKQPRPEKKEEKKGGAKDLKDHLDNGKEKGLSKEKSNLDKKSKKTK